MACRSSLLLPALWLAGAFACGAWPVDEDVPTPLRDAEDAAWTALAAQAIAVSGRVVDADGEPLQDVQVVLDGAATRTDASGAWSIAEMPRRNALLHLSASGFRTWVSAVQLARPRGEDSVVVPAVPMTRSREDTVRLLFTGDMALGRRYLDPDEVTPRDQMPPLREDAIIRLDHAADDSVAVVDSMLPFFEAADARIINLETPVLDDPVTPHTDKQYAFFTLPQSLSALQHLGVDVVSLGNNHVYDYLALGITETLRHIAASGVGFAGAGTTPDQAFVPVDVDVAGHPFTFISATSITGVGRTFPLFVATDEQGGAADLRDTPRVTAAFEAATGAGRWPVALWHSGNEYARFPSEYLQDRADLASRLGAAVVIAHHPHTAQGFSRVGGTLFAHSMGNFAFDQDRLETLVGYVLYTDVAEGDVVAASLVPQMIDDYRARPVTGALADRIARDAGELSDHDDVYVVSYASRGFLAESPEDLVTSERAVLVPMVRDEEGAAYFDLRGLRREGESIARIEAGSEATWSLGTDLLRFGDMEDDDVDADWLENARWFHGDSGGPCVTGARTGAAGLCAWRTHDQQDAAVLAFRNRVRVLGDSLNEPNRDLTLLGWHRADNAGAIEVYTRYYASAGELTFGDELVVRHSGGTWDWSPFAATLHMPDDQEDAVDPWEDNPRALRVFVTQRPPVDGEGRLAVDDLAVVTWHMGPWRGSSVDVVTPHGADFVRAVGLSGDAPVRVTLERAVPAAVARWIE